MIHPKKIIGKVCKDVCARSLIKVLFIIVNKHKQAKYPKQIIKKGCVTKLRCCTVWNNWKGSSHSKWCCGPVFTSEKLCQVDIMGFTPAYCSSLHLFIKHQASMWWSHKHTSRASSGMQKTQSLTMLICVWESSANYMF